MRNDMLQVLIHGPSTVQYYSNANHKTLQNRVKNKYRAAKQFILDYENEVCDEYCRTTLPMKHRRLGKNRKMFTPNLNPLARYLETQCGRTWNDVFSEVSAHLRSSTSAAYWITGCIFWFVHICTTRGSDGRVRDADNGYGGKCDFAGNFYVEPETGKLRVGTHSRKLE